MRISIRTTLLCALLVFVVQVSGCGGGDNSGTVNTAPVQELAQKPSLEFFPEPSPEPSPELSPELSPEPSLGPAPGDPRPFVPEQPAPEQPAPDPRLPAAALLDGFDLVSDDLWDDTAVRKVLQTFAYGGQATDAQIEKWADMPPDQAIVQMFTFDQHNPLLSPTGPDDYDRLDTKDGTLAGLAQFWASDTADNGINIPDRVKYDELTEAVSFLGGRVAQLTWARAATSRGLNPFRHKVGLWETNYHLATNRVVVPVRAMINYYDTIMAALEAGLPYQNVLAEAAKSAAVAIQYGHRNNVYVNGECQCNEDFAREFHQLFFGILGAGDVPLNYHETVSIKNTALALTDMNVGSNGELGGFASEVTFGTEKHTPGALEILHVSIEGVNAAERIDNLVQVAIEHPESLNNLPVKIIGGLADDNLTEDKKDKVRRAWNSMTEKNLLDFLRAYAVSTLYHDSSRIKYRTSIDRQLLIANLVTLNNEEGYLDLYNPMVAYGSEGVRAFFPINNVFGGQTGEEASTSPLVFHNNFDRVTQNASRYIQASGDNYERVWEKDWAAVIPRSGAGYVVRDVAEWLWQRFIADGLKRLGPLERAQLYALLGVGVDLSFFMDPENDSRVMTVDDVQSDPNISSVVSSLAQELVMLDSTDSSMRARANQRIGQAINFIVGTPFLFAEEGK